MKWINRATVLITIAIAQIVFAQTVSPSAPVRMKDLGLGGSSSAPTMTTTAARTYYVRTTGNDSNTCLSSSSPCLTIAGAISKIPKQIYHATIVDIGSGSFAGAVIEGFNVHPAAGGTSYLELKGTMSTATGLASGTATGTVTSFSALSGSTLPVITDSGQSWTANDLRGKFVQLSTSTTALYAISENTATTLTVPLASGISAGATYTIVDPATNITTAHSATIVADSQTGLQSRCLTVVGGASQNFGTFPSIQVDRINFACNTTTHVGVDGPARAYFRWVKVTGGASSFSGMQFGGGASVVVQNSIINMTTSSSATLSNGISGAFANIRQGSAGNLHLSGNLIWGGGNGIVAGGTYVGISSTQLFGQNTEAITGHTSSAYALSMSVAATRIDCNSTGATGIFVGANSPDGGGYGIFSMGLNGANISNCAIGVAVNGLNGAVLKSLAGSGNTVAISAIRGGKVQVYSDVTIGGTTELNVDSTNTTLAAMRAASPKHIKDSNYFTVVYE